jgi:hypothetical protein
MEYFAGLDVSMAETHVCALTIRLMSASIAKTAASTAARAATRPRMAAG